MNSKDSCSLPKFKVCVIGDSGVGKSMIIKSLSNGGVLVPREQYPLATTGVDITQHEITAGEHRCHLNIWDTVGQERFLSVSTGYLRSALVVLLVYDITDSSSFESIPKWLEKAKTEADWKCLCMLIGNKVDMDENRMVSQIDANQFARKHKLEFFECSAVRGRNVLFLFNQIAKDIAIAYPDLLQEQARPDDCLTAISISSTKSPIDDTKPSKKPDCCS